MVVKMAGGEGFYDGQEHYGDVEKTAARVVEGGQNTQNVLATWVEGRKIK